MRLMALSSGASWPGMPAAKVLGCSSYITRSSFGGIFQVASVAAHL